MYAIRSYYVNGVTTGTLDVYLNDDTTLTPLNVGDVVDPNTVVRIPAGTLLIGAGEVLGQDDGGNDVVITSYSIHYTKLYDPRHRPLPSGAIHRTFTLPRAVFEPSVARRSQMAAGDLESALQPPGERRRT